MPRASAPRRRRPSVHGQKTRAVSTCVSRCPRMAVRMAVPLLSPTRRVYLIGDEKELAENGRLWKELNLGHELARDLRALYETRKSGPGRKNWHNMLVSVVWVGHPIRRLVVPIYGTLRDKHKLIKVYEPHRL